MPMKLCALLDHTSHVIHTFDCSFNKLINFDFISSNNSARVDMKYRVVGIITFRCELNSRRAFKAGLRTVLKDKCWSITNCIRYLVNYKRKTTIRTYIYLNIELNICLPVPLVREVEFFRSSFVTKLFAPVRPIFV